MTSRPPRLLQFANYGGSYSGSFVPMVTALARAARDRDWPTELIFSEKARAQAWVVSLEQEGFAYRFLDLRSAGGPARWGPTLAAEATRGRWQGRVGRAISSLLAGYRGPTILHTHFSMFDMPVAQAARAVPQARVLWHEHSPRPAGNVSEIGGALRYRLVARNVSAFLCVAPDIAEIVARQGAGDRAVLLPNAVDTDRFSPARLSRRNQVRHGWGVAPETVVLVHFGSDWRRKGGDIFVAALRLLLRASPVIDLRAFIVGLDEAQRAVDASGLRDRVTVLAPTEGVEDLYAAADLFVSPSRAEGMPLAVLEALAVGVPVVATDIPGQATVGNSVLACRLSAHDPESVAVAIRQMLALDDETRRGQRATARKWIVDNVGLEAWVRAIMETYDRAVDTNGSL